MLRPEKVQVVTELSEKLSTTKSVVFADYRGLNVKEVTELRKKLRDAGVEYKVVKNTLARLAAQKAEVEGVNLYLTGPTAIALGLTDPVAPAKILSEFAKTHKNLEIKGGVLQGKVIDLDGVKSLANLPSREVLLAQLLAGMQAPVTGFVSVLSGTMRKLVYALDAVRRTKEEGQAGADAADAADATDVAETEASGADTGSSE